MLEVCPLWELGREKAADDGGVGVDLGGMHFSGAHERLSWRVFRGERGGLSLETMPDCGRPLRGETSNSYHLLWFGAAQYHHR